MYANIFYFRIPIYHFILLHIELTHQFHIQNSCIVYRLNLHPVFEIHFCNIYWNLTSVCQVPYKSYSYWYLFLVTVLLSLILNVHSSCSAPLHKVYLLNLYVVIHYIVRYYIVIPVLITRKRYVHEKENPSTNHNTLFTDHSLQLSQTAGLSYY